MKIDGKIRRAHWRDGQTLVLDDEPYDIQQVITENGIMSFSLVPWVKLYAQVTQ